MFERLESVERRYLELEQLLAETSASGAGRDFAKIAKERSELEPVVAAYREWRSVEASIAESETLAEDSDEEMRAMAREELTTLGSRRDELRRELRLALLPKDPKDDRSVVLEIRAGTGGDEAALFAASLFRMYARYAESRGWRVEEMSSSSTGLGGFKEVIALVDGPGAYSRLKFESGVHRVQRVPETETSGRIHTSAVTVAVMAEADDVEVDIADKDLRIDVMRASGPGGQSVNTTDSAVRITHIPTGSVVVCRDEKSQHKNKAKALKVLRSRLLEQAQREQHDAIAAERKGQVGSGDRSERVRTYNFPQGRVTDHRINLTLHMIERIVDGDLDPVIDELATAAQAAALQASGLAAPGDSHER